MDILTKVATPIGLDQYRTNGRRPKCVITFDDALESFVSNGVPELASRNIPFVVFVPTGSIGQKPNWLSGTQHKDEGDTVASVSRLMSISSNDVTFGSHSVNHPDLTALCFDEARSEIEESKQFLESSLKREIRYFSFPHGALNVSTIELCRKTGYSQVFSTLPESPLKSVDGFVKGRTKVDPSDWSIEFVLKALGGYGWKGMAASVRQKLRGS
jgi:peptidoglycan/xylan/chitin deacetylase (PgdA/CDA1 family)